MSEWKAIEDKLIPTKPGKYVCILRGEISIKIMKFENNLWKNMNGIQTRKVTHWLEIPELPISIRMDILLKKGADLGLDKAEKEELSNLLGK